MNCDRRLLPFDAAERRQFKRLSETCSECKGSGNVDCEECGGECEYECQCCQTWVECKECRGCGVTKCECQHRPTIPLVRYVQLVTELEVWYE